MWQYTFVWLDVTIQIENDCDNIWLDVTYPNWKQAIKAYIRCTSHGHCHNENSLWYLKASTGFD